MIIINTPPQPKGDSL